MAEPRDITFDGTKLDYPHDMRGLTEAQAGLVFAYSQAVSLKRIADALQGALPLLATIANTATEKKAAS